MVIPLGSHELEVEGDLIITRLHGDFTPEQMQEWCRVVDGVIAAHGRAFSIGNYRGAGAIPPRTRRIAGDWLGSAKLRAMAVVGASAAVRLIMTMIARAGALLRNFRAPVAFFDTEAEARTWMHEQRAKHS